MIQSHLEAILRLAIDPHVEIRLAAVNCLRVILDQGLVHPMQVYTPVAKIFALNLSQCVPNLIALETDQEAQISDRAHRLLLMLSEKYPGFLFNRLADGVKLSHSFQSLYTTAQR